jgi:hypothetical protein
MHWRIASGLNQPFRAAIKQVLSLRQYEDAATGHARAGTGDGYTADAFARARPELMPRADAIADQPACD